jgi:pyruvate/2-oxoglutarate dehydrogenase complex dihydrolipoamide dehydrogenase (E3) component
MVEEVDVVIIGLGVGGEAAAGDLATAGLAVVGIENRLVGGECPYWGCVPSKMMIRASNLLEEARRVNGLAGLASVTPNWTPVAKRIRQEATDTWNDKVAVDRLVDKGAQVVRGTGRLVAPGHVVASGNDGDTEYRARKAVIIGTGTSPAIPPIDGLADTPYWTNREAIEVEWLPDSLIVLGGGGIGLELAQMFARFGVRVSIIEASDRVLSVEEPESSQLAAEALARDGVEVRTKAQVRQVRHDGEAFTVALADGSTMSSATLLVATGRRAQLGSLGVDTVGLDPKARSVNVNDRLRAGDRLWAIGDVTGKGAFTHIAMYQAGIAVADILGRDWPPADYRALPRVTFTDPEIGAVGLTEHQARERGIDVRTGTGQVPSTSRGWIHKVGNEGFIKLIADTQRGVLVGATSAGPWGGEVMSALAVAVHGEVPVERLRHMIFAYPTFHRGISDALCDLD